MKPLIFAAGIVFAATLPANAGTVYSGAQMERMTLCPPEIIIGPDGKEYSRAENCPDEFSQYSTMGIPLDGNWNRGMRAHALRFRPLPDGHIQLY